LAELGFETVALAVGWGRSDIMTFVVNQQGKLYEKHPSPEAAVLEGLRDLRWETKAGRLRFG
jgi:hypothetical protein